MSDLAEAESLASSRPFRVLIVEDEPDMAAILARMLRSENMAVETVSDGEAALRRACEEPPPDLVLLDVILPGVDGFQTCERLKRKPATAMLPVVLVTALEDTESRVRGIEAGADDFLTKPVRREELIARVKTLRRLHETRRELEAGRLAAEVQRKERLRAAFARYVSPRLVDRIVEDGDAGAPFGGEPQRSPVVALFADLRGFTRLTESTDVARVVDMLNQYFSILTEVAYRQDGTIFSMGGDSLLVGFNVPFPQDDAEARAWLAARDMIARFAPVAAEWRWRSGLALGIGVGICSGEAIVGNVGSPHYMSYTLIGDPVNTAARLMEAAGENEILVSEPVYRGIRDLVPGASVERRGALALRGKSEPTTVYSISIRVPSAA